MKRGLIVSSNFLERIADPASQFHRDYLAYRARQISWDELIARLPHVAMLGDSVCMGIYISSPWSTFWRARGCRGKNWFIDIDSMSAGVASVSKRLEKLTPFVAIQVAGVGALVDHARARPNF